MNKFRIHSMFCLLPLFIMALVIFASESTKAQISENVSPISITSKPSGVSVYIEGNLVGKTPCTFTLPLIGKYRVRGVKRGYTSWSSNFEFTGTGRDTVWMTLSEKNRFEAACRSLVVPGWGQSYSDKPGKAKLFAVLQLSLLASLVASDYNYSKTVNDYEKTYDTYNSRQKYYEEQQKLWQEVLDRKDKADFAYDLRKGLFIASACFWIYNVLDVLFLFPKYYRELPTLSANMSFDRGEFRFTISKHL